jgi:hypothetical protein
MKLPIGIQDFEKIRTGGYLYIDKTEHVYRLASEGSYYFLSRPRRFGKSLLISTLKALFLGKRELFKGLAIDKNEDWDWAVHPVLHLDLNTNKYDKAEVLEQKLDESLNEWETLYDCARPDLPFGMRFEKVIKSAYEKTGQRVVILVDEYDKPMLQAIGNKELQDEYRGTLKGFYGALKSMDGCIKFAMLTGVTKFGKVSVFSDLNNLMDISMLNKYHNICGITEEELLRTFDDNINELAENNGMEREECIDKLRRMYDGYHFNHLSKEGIYNPFSVLNTFSSLEFGSYWFETGTPSYLVELLRRHHYNLEEMSKSEVTADVLNSIDAESHDPIPVIYQSGYLTIKGYKERFKKYILGFPNEEVEEGFIKYLAPFYLSKTNSHSAFDVEKFAEDVETGQPEQFCKRLQTLLASAPYDAEMTREGNYQNVIWVVFKMMGFYTEAEYKTSDGRIDLLIETSDYRYVIDFKLDGTAEEALQQIKDKQYTLQYELDSKRTFLIGMNFDSDARTIEKWAME